MRFALILALLPAVAAGRASQDQVFDSPEFGVRLKIPAGWAVGSIAGAEILKLSLPGKHDFSPQVAVQNLLFPEEHITLGQYREQFRQFIQQNFAEPRILEDRSLTVGGKPSMVFTWSWKAKDGPALHFKSFTELAPTRLLSVELVAPKALEGAAKTFDTLLASLEFIARKKPEGTDEAVKKFGEIAAKLPATDPAFERKSELDYVLGDQTVGSWSQQMKAATRDGAAGLDVVTVDIIDLGANGRLEKRTTVFLSDDLSKQRAEVEIIHRGKPGRVQYFTASVALDGTDVTVDRRLNGEKSTVKLKAPERTILDEALEAVEFRLLAAGKGPTISVPVLQAFDNEPSFVKAEHTGEHEMKIPGAAGLAKISVFVVARENGTIITYWFDKDRKLTRRSVGGQNIILQEKK